MQEKLVFMSGRYRLYRLEDGAGDAGGMLLALDPETAKPVDENGVVLVGYPVMCGSHYARSFQWQDWWLCTAVKEIVEQGEGWAKVITQSNREYLVGDSEAVSRKINEARKLQEQQSEPSDRSF